MKFKTDIFFIAIIFIEIFSDSSGKSVKIIGGKNADIKEFPHQVSIRYTINNKHFCGGTILTASHILTAAHCVKDMWPPYSDVRIHTATKISNSIIGPKHKVLIVHMHPGYTGKNESLFRHDIAIVTIDGSIAFNGFQKSIELPSEDVRVGDTGMISGWGHKIKNQFGVISIELQKVSMKIVKQSVCSKLIGHIIHGDQFCAFQKAGVGGCNGDSGGPLTSHGKVVGVISFVVPCATGVPDVFTNVYAYLDFIQFIIKK